MENIIIARYGEIHLKGANRGYFLSLLKNNLVRMVGEYARVDIENSRVMVSVFDAQYTEMVAQKVANVFGIVSVSIAQKIEATLESIIAYFKDYKLSGEFKVEVNRADKTFPMNSYELCARLGEIILKNNPSSKVNVREPQITVNVDIRLKGIAFVYDKVIEGVGGMPVHSAGRALVMLSGGIDSPVSAWLVAKRGMSVNFLHFASPPYTSDMALDKVKKLGKKLQKYLGDAKLIVVNLTDIQEKIHAYCRHEYTITLMRRFMIRIAHEIATKGICVSDCIVTGENLSQVASQTIQGIASNNILARELPILRPLITYDKVEIIALAKRIDTYETSCIPHADCCTVFVPEHPSIKPSISKLEFEESKLDVDSLVQNAIKTIEVHTC